MKKRLLVLGMIICMLLGLTACGSSAQDETNYMADADALGLAEYCFGFVGSMDATQIETAEKQGYDVSVVKSARESYESAMKEPHTVTGMGELKQNTMDVDVTEGTVLAEIKGTDHDATIEVVYEKGAPTSITVNTVYTFAEGMEKAALNTLLGMGTVFVVLILISFIISCFNFIPKIQAAFSKKPKQEEIKTKAVDNTIAQIIEKEELSDDLELVAVIAAAVAASQGASSTDGFVVRSIRKHIQIQLGGFSNEKLYNYR